MSVYLGLASGTILVVAKGVLIVLFILFILLTFSYPLFNMSSSKDSHEIISVEAIIIISLTSANIIEYFHHRILKKSKLELELEELYVI